MQQDILFWRLQKLEPCGVFPSGIHHIADHPAPDIPIISATGDFFVDRPFFCGIEKKFTVDLIQVFRYPVVFDSFQIFFYHYPLQLGEQVACMDSCGGRCLPCGSQKGKRQFPFASCACYPLVNFAFRQKPKCGFYLPTKSIHAPLYSIGRM